MCWPRGEFSCHDIQNDCTQDFAEGKGLYAFAGCARELGGTTLIPLHLGRQ